MSRQLRTPDLSQTAAYLVALFDPDDNVCFKPDPYTRSSEPAQFVCINPLRDPEGKVSLENIASYQAVLIEFDKGTLKAQADKYERRLGLPYTTKTFSGKKSLHYVIRLDKPCTHTEYVKLTAVLHAYIQTCDTSSKNPNRLSRTAGIVRSDTGKQQTLLAVGERCSYDGLMQLIAYRAPMVYVKALQAIEQAQRRQAERETSGGQVADKADDAPLLGWVQYMIDTGSYDGTSRHAAMVRVASALKGEGYSLDRIEGVLYQLQDRFALERNDVPGVIRWVQRI